MYSIINKFKKTKGLEFVGQTFIDLEKENDRNLTHLLNKLHNN